MYSFRVVPRRVLCCGRRCLTLSAIGMTCSKCDKLQNISNYLGSARDTARRQIGLWKIRSTHRKLPPFDFQPLDLKILLKTSCCISNSVTSKKLESRVSVAPGLRKNTTEASGALVITHENTAEGPKKKPKNKTKTPWLIFVFYCFT